MKKRLFYFFTITFFIYSGLFILITYLLKTTSGKEIIFPDILIEGLLPSIITVGMISTGVFITIKPKINYLESSQLNEPPFSYEVYTFSQTNKISYKELKSRINERFLTTYTNDEQMCLKFCRKINILDWGQGVLLKYNIEKELIHCAVFPFSTIYKKDKFALYFKEVTGCELINEEIKK